MRNMKKYMLPIVAVVFMTAIDSIPSFGSTVLNGKSNGFIADKHLLSKEGMHGKENMAEENLPKLVLIGIVYDKITHAPLSNSIVELIDQTNNQKSRYTTNSDGHFYFKLSIDKNYMLSALNSKGEVDDQKQISTINKSENEILHAVLQSSRPEMPAQLSYTEKPSPVTASANKDVSTELVFKIQVGAFKEKLNSQSSFVKGLGSFKLNVEEANNGYYRYLTGDFTRLSDAQELERTLKQQGYTKSFIVPYLKGERLKSTPEEAQQKYGK